MSSVEDRMIDLLVQYITDATQLEESLVKIIVGGSSFAEILKEDSEWVGHYSLDYWAERVLSETAMKLKQALESMSNRN